LDWGKTGMGTGSDIRWEVPSFLDQGQPRGDDGHINVMRLGVEGGMSTYGGGVQGKNMKRGGRTCVVD